MFYSIFLTLAGLSVLPMTADTAAPQPGVVMDMTGRKLRSIDKQHFNTQQEYRYANHQYTKYHQLHGLYQSTAHGRLCAFALQI